LKVRCDWFVDILQSYDFSYTEDISATQGFYIFIFTLKKIVFTR